MEGLEPPPPPRPRREQPNLVAVPDHVLVPEIVLVPIVVVRRQAHPPPARIITLADDPRLKWPSFQDWRETIIRSMDDS